MIRLITTKSWVFLLLFVAPPSVVARGQSRPRPEPKEEFDSRPEEELDSSEDDLQAIVDELSPMIPPTKKPGPKSPWLEQLYEESLQKQNGVEEGQEEGFSSEPTVRPPAGLWKRINGKSWLLVKIVGDNENKALRKMLSDDRTIRLQGCTKYVCYCYMPLNRVPKYNALDLVRTMDIPMPVARGSLRQRQQRGQPDNGQEEGRRKEATTARSLVGSVTNEALQAMRVDQVRDIFGLTGRNMTIGVISDSFDTLGGYAQDVASGDLPPNIAVLREFSQEGIDEGRAMIQLIYDLLPDAKFAFYTGFEDPVDFANGITALADYGCDVIVDDIGWYTEPFFQDGVIAQAANDIAEIRGIPFFSAAGNDGQDSWQGPFRGTGIRLGSCELHNFATTGTPDVLQTILVGDGDTFFFQWDDIHFSLNGAPGAQSDVDIFLYNSTGGIFASFQTTETGIDPIISFTVKSAPADNILQMAISHCSGPAPTVMKWIRTAGFNSTVDFGFEHNTQSSTCIGHPNAAYVAAVGAADFRQTPVFGTNPAIVQNYSSSGGTPIVFDRFGNRLPGRGDIRLKPLMVAPDMVINTFFGDEDFRSPSGLGFYFPGTSAAAPNAAAVAALLLEIEPDLLPFDIYTFMTITAGDMETEGFDFRTGYGLVNALAAVTSLLVSIPNNPPVAAPTTFPPVFIPPTFQLTGSPTDTLTGSPTEETTTSPTGSLSPAPSPEPTGTPTTNSVPTAAPTEQPTTTTPTPTGTPTFSPSLPPVTGTPTETPSEPPVVATAPPTTGTPTTTPTSSPTTGTPTETPSEAPVVATAPPTTGTPTASPSSIPTTGTPTETPSEPPFVATTPPTTGTPTTSPTSIPTTETPSESPVVATTPPTTETPTTTSPTSRPSTQSPTSSSAPTETCPGPATCEDGTLGTCVQPRPDEKGCSCSGCECQVCQVDSYCCDTKWDGLCVLVANSVCRE